MSKHQFNENNEVLDFVTSTELLGFVLPLAQDDFEYNPEFIQIVCQQLVINTGVNFSLAFFTPHNQI